MATNTNVRFVPTAAISPYILLSSELALRGSAFSFGPGLPVRIVSECDREAQERGQHQPQIEHIDCAHAGIS